MVHHLCSDFQMHHHHHHRRQQCLVDDDDDNVVLNLKIWSGEGGIVKVGGGGEKKKLEKYIQHTIYMKYQKA